MREHAVKVADCVSYIMIVTWLKKKIVNLLDDRSDGATLLLTGKQRKVYGKDISQLHAEMSSAFYCLSRVVRKF